MDLDTSIGGNQARFPETRRSAIVDLRSEEPDHPRCRFGNSHHRLLEACL